MIGVGRRHRSKAAGMATRCMFLLSSASALSLPAAAPVVVLGPGSLDLRLLTAKLAARSGLQTSLFSASGGVQDIWLEQMYGVEDGSTDIENSAEPLRPAMVADADAREAALAAAEGLALISDGVAMPEAALSSVLAVAPQLKRVVCLSKMGVTRATAGPLGFGKEMVEQLEAEVRMHEPNPSPRPSPSPSPNPNLNPTLNLALIPTLTRTG